LKIDRNKYTTIRENLPSIKKMVFHRNKALKKKPSTKKGSLAI